MHDSRFSHARIAFVSLAITVLFASGCSSHTTGNPNRTNSPQPSVTVSGANQVRLGSTTNFTAAVANLTNTAVTWQVNTVAGGNSTVGTITSAGVYTPPGAVPPTNSVTITAVSVAAPTASGSAQVDIANPIPVIASATATLATGTSYSLDVLGTSFVEGAQIQIDGIGANTTFISATELKATVSVPEGTFSLSVAVLNPNPGSVTSNTASAPVSFASATAAARLLDQATFGPTLAEIQNVQSIGIDAYITSQFNTPDTPLPNITLPFPAVCLAANLPTVCEESEWWQIALTGQDQLRQRVAFALSELFVISSDNDNAITITYYHNMLANDAFTNFATIMNDVSLSPGMGAYLNMLNSAKAPVGQTIGDGTSHLLAELHRPSQRGSEAFQLAEGLPIHPLLLDGQHRNLCPADIHPI